MDFIEQASQTLKAAYSTAALKQKSNCQFKEFIDFVIDNNHLTYKYILLTALLANATKNTLNPLCLQKHSTLEGAYDARTLCHKIIVPFEMDILNKVLGGSNEPYLNKPARFPELNKTNAVRRGNDKKILDSLCDNLPLIKQSNMSYDALVYLLQKLIEKRDLIEEKNTFIIPNTFNLPSTLINFIGKALLKSYEGEILTLMVAGVYHLHFMDSAVVEVHPVNQSGKSTHEISDLDIYKNSVLISSNELKDKPYTDTDVRHAADKVILAGGTKMLFIEGPRGIATGDFTKLLVSEYAARNFMLDIVPHDMFFRIMVSILEKVDLQEFVSYILKTAHNTKFKHETIDYLFNLAREELDLS